MRIRDVFGAEHLARLVEIPPYEGEGFRLSGFLAKPGQGRRDRLQQFVIMNGRPIVCPAVQQPLREAYADALERGSHPLCVLNIEMDPQLVDCNVHPAKREVRLRQPEALRRAIFEAARAAIAPVRERTAAPSGTCRPADLRPGEIAAGVRAGNPSSGRAAVRSARAPGATPRPRRAVEAEAGPIIVSSGAWRAAI